MSIQTEGWVHIGPAAELQCLFIVYLHSILTVPQNGWSLYTAMFVVKLIKRCEFSLKSTTGEGTCSGFQFIQYGFATNIHGGPLVYSADQGRTK